MNRNAWARPMWALLIPMLAMLSMPANAQVDPKVAAQCKDARDFVGCVKAFTTPALAPDDGLDGLRNAMKQVAARLQAGTSYNDSTETFRPLIDQLAIVESTHPDSLAVNEARLAAKLFDALQEAWQARIKAEYYELNKYGGTKVYKCNVLKLSADLFNTAYGSQVINWSYNKGAFGWDACKVEYGQLPEDYMRPIINRVLINGSVSPKALAERKEEEAKAEAKRKKERVLCEMGPWNRRLEEDPKLKAWAKANPSAAKEAMTRFIAKEGNKSNCSSVELNYSNYFAN